MIIKSTYNLSFANELFSDGAYNAAQGGLELLGSSNPLLLASGAVETTGIHNVHGLATNFITQKYTFWSRSVVVDSLMRRFISYRKNI